MIDYLHIVNKSNISVLNGIIKNICENFDKDRHMIAVIGKPGDISIEIQHVFIDGKNQFSVLFPFMKDCKKIILHALCINFRCHLKMMANPWLMKKTYWIAWGADLYEFINEKTSIKKIIGLLFRKNVAAFIGIYEPDIEIFKKNISKRKKCFFANYSVGERNDYELHKKLYKPHDTLNILIGHQCSRELNHEQAITQLAKYKNDNIRVIIPLSYGDMKHGDTVEKLAINTFGEKAVCMREKISPDEYNEMLANIDIAIFNSFRQIGLGNIYRLLYCEKKIYMPSESIMYKYYRSKNIPIEASENISSMSFDEFRAPVDMKIGFEYMRGEMLNEKKYIDRWSKIYTL